MPIRSSRFDDVISNVAASARKRGIQVDPSFAIELHNYAGHLGVRDLAEDDLAEVLGEIGTRATTHGDMLNGVAIRKVINKFCGPFSVCAGTAYNVLRTMRREDAASKLESIVRAALDKAKIDG